MMLRSTLSLHSKVARRHVSTIPTLFSRNNEEKRQTIGFAVIPQHLCSPIQQRPFSSFPHRNTAQVTASNIIDFCSSHGINSMGLRQQSQHVVIKECPFCDRPTKGSADNQHKIYIKIGDGVYFCHRCGAKGSWNDFRRKIGGGDGNFTPEEENVHISMTPRYPTAQSGISSNAGTATGNNKCLPMPNERLSAAFISKLLDNDDPSNDALDYLTNVRGIHKSTLRKYGVGQGVYNFPGLDGKFVPADCVTFPWILPAAEVAEQEELRGATLTPGEGHSGFVTRRIKARALENKAWQRLDPPGGGWGLFGYHTIPEDATEVVVTEGEYDAMAGTH